MNNKIDLERIETSHWKTYLFFTLLVVAVLIQAVVLRWNLEAVFFVTWFLLMLVVKHDTRLSPALGLIFLATCPFLLIADNEPAAEQAANYAYFFLAIGVLVQAEEMILERRDRLGWKVDISYLWQPAAEELRRRWASAETASTSTGTTPKLAGRTRWLLILAFAGLVLVFLGAAYTGLDLPLLVPLIGGSLVFIILVWGLHWVLRSLGKIQLSRLVLLLVLVPLVVVAGVWVDDFYSTNGAASMEVIYNFVVQPDTASNSTLIPEGEVVEVQEWTIENTSKRVLYQHPSLSAVNRISFPVMIEPGTVLAFDLGMSPETWQQPGDGVIFNVFLESEQGILQLFSDYIDPKNKVNDRRWHPHTIDLSEYAGQEVSLIFETGTGPEGDYQYDWAGWGEPRLLVPSRQR
jgi:hypothetical protein